MLQSIQPKLKQLVTATVATTKPMYMTTQTTLVNGWKNHKKAVLWGLGLFALAVIGAVAFIYLWRKSPTFRAMVLATVAAAASNAQRLLAWLKRRAANEDALAVELAPFEIYPDGDPGEVKLAELNILSAQDPTLVKSPAAEDGHQIY